MMDAAALLFSFHLARMWGIFLFLVCFSLLLNQKRFASTVKKMDASSAFLFGFILLIIGSIQVVGYERWSLDWMGFITFLGWATLLKGIAFLFIPGYSEKMLKLAVKDNFYNIFIFVGMIIGIYLLSLSYILPR